MEFFNSAVGVLQTLVIALGAGLGIWGAINLMEGYGNELGNALLTPVLPAGKYPLGVERQKAIEWARPDRHGSYYGSLWGRKTGDGLVDEELPKWVRVNLISARWRDTGPYRDSRCNFSRPRPN